VSKGLANTNTHTHTRVSSISVSLMGETKLWGPKEVWEKDYPTPPEGLVM